ncbi:equilibrative nucleobase transporter 1-like isoform X1 [Poeciliopsis prolifica]|uniref:equilibrative nucleobase transporter 1-like isoform X1 n=1 Tax=Poeciliopsis prolifica TaxID=188132 RepID=UPI0024138890|nr:equilibrative nucleobase transporter 1-like isoform X1 [Poeciliopsis prolifica]XP_054890088.1 equilibrative nucleobase transporter 1-like isoform X1 [Poeciliopsis prolifica]XP_054890089.1 equilibrative nucleobase transporter 1-like isoform X1 [Poeciliopsis prolifica]XP_054890090.1 equilibrative nucleobase transporter 1-like isoform X1 [Poeciliopsis prolifica]
MPEPQNKLSVRRCLTFATGLVECLCFAGAVFGWAALVFVLKEDRYFSSLCVNTTRVNGTQTLDCSAQDEQYSLIFTIASFMNNFLTLPNGFLFDRFGTTLTRLYGIFLYTMGTLMVAFSSSALAYLLFPALSFLAVGGILLLMTNIQVGNLFGSRRSTIITLYNGAFDSSSALFLIIKLLHESGVSLRTSFLFLSACSVVHILRTFFLLPRNLIPYPLPDRFTYGVTCGNSVTASAEVAANGEAHPAPEETAFTKNAPVKQGPVKSVIYLSLLSGVGLFLFVVPLHLTTLCLFLSLSEKTFRECLLSRFFMWHLLWLSVMQLRHYLFIGTLNPMLQRMTGGEASLVSQYTNAFAITQLCGVLCAPWNGLIMDRHKGKPRAAGETEQEADLRASVLSLFLTALQCVLFSLCASTPYLPLQYLTFILQVLNRSFLYGGNAAFISVAFPSCHFGKLYGLVMALSAVFSLLQYPCFALVKGPLGGDPLYVNVGLTLLSVLAFIHPVFVFMHCRNLASERARSKASS